MKFNYIDISVTSDESPVRSHFKWDAIRPMAGNYAGNMETEKRIFSLYMSVKFASVLFALSTSWLQITISYVFTTYFLARKCNHENKMFNIPDNILIKVNKSINLTPEITMNQSMACSH